MADQLCVAIDGNYRSLAITDELHTLNCGKKRRKEDEVKIETVFDGESERTEGGERVAGNCLSALKARENNGLPGCDELH